MRRPRGSGSGRDAGERGAVTAEAAVVLPLLVLVAAGLAWLVCLGVAQVRALDAAREVARVVARGDQVGRATELGRRVAPDDATVRVERGDGRVVVTVRASVSGPGGLFEFLPDYQVHAEAVAAAEGQQ